MKRTHCKKCNKEFTPKQINNHNVYCSRECYGKKPIIKKVCTCQVCGIEFKRLKRDRTGLYCSKSCSCKSMWQKRYEENPQFKKNQEIVKLIKVLNRFQECIYCNQKFVITSQTTITGKNRRTYCYEDACIKQHASIKVREWAERNHNENREIITCKYCNREYLREYGEKNTTFCSDLCLKRYHDQLRHLRERMSEKDIIELPNRFVIFKRDNHKCHICGKKIDMKLPHPHPMSATLDHVIPIARGGKHEAKNLKAAHLSCNSAKGADIIESKRLTLFG